jgi:hypothetical protein
LLLDFLQYSLVTKHLVFLTDGPAHGFGVWIYPGGAYAAESDFGEDYGFVELTANAFYFLADLAKGFTDGC